MPPKFNTMVDQLGFIGKKLASENCGPLLFSMKGREKKIFVQHHRTIEGICIFKNGQMTAYFVGCFLSIVQTY